MDPQPQSPEQRRAMITGRGWHMPPDILTNEDIAGVLDPELLTEWVTQNKWCQEQLAGLDTVDRALEEKVFSEYVEKRIGIRTRHVIDRQAILENRPSTRGIYASNLGVGACRKALSEAGVVPEDVEVIICGSSTPDRIYPTTGIEIQERLGAPHAHAYDLLAACSSFGYALHAARGMIQAGMHQRILVVSAEYFTAQVNYRDPNSAFFWGDGAAAVLLEAPEAAGKKPGLQILDSFGGSRLSDNIRTGLGGTRPFIANAQHLRDHGTAPAPMGELSYPFFFQDGHRVYRDVVPIVVQEIQAFLERNELSPQDIRRFWCHQPSLIFLGGIMKRLIGERLPSDRVFLTFEEHGNTSSTAAPLCLAKDDGIKAGELVCMVMFGAGYTYSGVLLRKT